MNKVFYSCDEHVDCVIDDFLNMYCLIPELNFNDKLLNCVSCNYCNKVAQYLVGFFED